MPSRNSEGGIERDTTYREYAVLQDDGRLATDGDSKRLAVIDFFENVLATGRRIYLVYPVPDISWDITRLNYDHFRKEGVYLRDVSIPYVDHQVRNKFVDRVLDDVSRNPNIRPIRPETMFCNSFLGGRCVAQHEFVPFYLDDDHVSDAGARLIVDEILRRFERDR
jgi:hypothetical protein